MVDVPACFEAEKQNHDAAGKTKMQKSQISVSQQDFSIRSTAVRRQKIENGMEFLNKCKHGR
jgi:hypothetical protein